MSIRIATIVAFLIFSVQYVHGAGCISGSNSLLCETKDILYSGAEAESLRNTASALGSPALIYEHLRNHGEYAPYHGARSNSINTFLSLRGNDVDLASALIAMLRSQGIRSRYAQGLVRMPKSQLANWLGVTDTALASSILSDQGIPGVDATDANLVAFQHVWVEALVNQSNYRGGASNSASACSTEGGTCQWVPIDPSFKQKTYKDGSRMLLRDLSFDLESYYNSQNPSSPKYIPESKNKPPLQMFEEKALAYLREHHPGITLEDVADPGSIIPDQAGLLPASLPYEVMGSVTRYNTIEDHDTAEEVDWTKYLNSRIVPAVCPEYGAVIEAQIPLSSLSTQRLTVTAFDSEGTTVLGHRLDNQRVGWTWAITGPVQFTCPSGGTFTLQHNSKVNVELEIDAEPYRDPVTATYQDLVVGGYYLIATGGETSNWSQARRAYENLLQANRDYPIVIDISGSLGSAGAAYVDSNLNGAADSGDIALLDHLPAMDALTGGLLHVAQAIYYTRFREESERYGRIKGIASPISAYLGIVSAMEEVEYLDDVPFAVMPGGLLIDLKGIRLNGTWEIDKPGTYSSEAFKFLGHIGSALEHEVWQQITGYDAISTVRGFQFALEDGETLLRVAGRAGDNTFPTVTQVMGFTHAAPAGFTKHEYTLFDKRMVAWTNPDQNAAFDVFRMNLLNVPADDPQADRYIYRSAYGLNEFYAEYDDVENYFIAGQTHEGQLKTNLTQDSNGATYQSYDVVSAQSGTSGFAVASFTRIGTSSYRYVLNETSQHSDSGSPYTVPVSLWLADPGDTRFDYYDPGLGDGFTLQSTTVLSPAGFTASGAKSGSQVHLTVGKNTSLANGTYSVQVENKIFRYPYLHTYTPTLSIEVINNRFVDATTSFNSGPFNVTDNTNLTCGGQTYTAAPSVLLPKLRTCFDNAVIADGSQDWIVFFDRNQGFDETQLAFRSEGIAIKDHPTDFVRQMQADVYHTTGGFYEYLLPSHMPQDTYYLFNVYLRDLYGPEGDLSSSSYTIVNRSNLLPAGGGYVDPDAFVAPQPLTPGN